MLTTMSSNIDRVLQGGLQVGTVTEIYGESGTGKTTLCMQLALATQLPPDVGGLGGQAFYIYCNGDFPDGTLYEMAKEKLPHTDADDVMENVTVRKINEVDQLSTALTAADEAIKGSQGDPMPVKLLIVDSICSLFYNQFPVTECGIKQRIMILKAIGKTLRTKFAMKYEIPVVVTNSTINTYDANHPFNFPSGGRVVRPKVVTPSYEQFIGDRWCLRKEAGMNDTVVRVIQMFKIHEGPTSPYAAFTITEAGIVDSDATVVTVAPRPRLPTPPRTVMW